LFNPASIKERHTIAALPAADKSQLRIGDTWSSSRTLSFGLTGPKSYERIYKLKEINKTNDRQIAEVEMSGAEQLKPDSNEQPADSFTSMFDTTETYAGHLDFDLSAGKVKSYSEKLNSEWIAIQPEEEVKEGEEPIVMIMGIKLLWSVEKLD
jgi:hypothetical protein